MTNLTIYHINYWNKIIFEGVAVGCGWQAFVAYVNVGCYYVVGIPLGILLGFYFNLEAKVYVIFT